MAVAQCGRCSVLFFEVVEWSDHDVVDFLLRHGVIHDVTACGKCGSECKLNRLLLEFRCQRQVIQRKQKAVSCSWRRSARINSFIAGSHLTPKKIIRVMAAFLWLKPPRTRFISKNCQISHTTVVDWFSFYREVLIEDCCLRSEMLGGPGCIVEIDEAKFGKRKYNRGRRVEGQWVFGGVDRASKKSFMVPVESRDAETLLSILQRWVLPGSTVYSDCWKAYNCLEQEGYRHLTVNHSLHFKDPDTGVHTNTVERQWREARANIPRYGVRKGHFVGYLAESQFKRKYTDEEERLHHFFLAAAALYPPI